MLLIVVAMWLAYQFNLHALDFLLSRAVELGFLALVIIFQPEIRGDVKEPRRQALMVFERGCGDVQHHLFERGTGLPSSPR